MSMGQVPEALVDSLLFFFPPSSSAGAATARTDHHGDSHRPRGSDLMIPIDIAETSKEYLFYADVPGLSKSDIQVTVEDVNELVISSIGKKKRKREEETEEEDKCKYIRLERRTIQFQKKAAMMRRFCLPQNADVSKITAKCENGVLSLAVQKLPPKSKTVQITVS